MKLSYVCPFCFSEHPIGDVEFACESRMICAKRDASGNVVGAPGAGEPDEKMRQYKHLNTAPIGPHHFRAPKTPKFSMPDSAVCDWCRQTSRTRVCPSCHNVLPSTIDSDEAMIISLIGTRGSGKSTYVGVLIHEMMKKLFHPFHGTFQLYGSEDQREYRSRFEDFLYSGQPIPQTTSHLVGNTMTENRPILGMLKMESGSFFNKVKPKMLVFFDSAGEDWTSQDTVNVVAKYVAESAGIVFLIDPLANRAVRSSIGDDTSIRASISADYESDSDPSVVIQHVANLIRNQKGLKENQKIGIPVAAAFSKLDVLEDKGLLPPGSALSQPSPHVQRGSFDEADASAVDQEMRGLLSAWDAVDVIDMLNMNYTTNHCFAFSAYGREPASDGTIAPPVPKRIEDAMFWLLHLNNVL